MKNKANWETLPVMDQEPIEIELLVKRFGNWYLGYAWVPLTIGGAPLGTHLALYASKKGSEPDRYICGSIVEVMNFWGKNKVPPKSAIKVLEEALSKGPLNEVKRYLP